MRFRLFARKPPARDLVFTGTLRVMNHSGDTALRWDKTDELSTETVRREFDRMIKKEKMLAYTIPGQGMAYKITDFEPEAREIRVHAQNRGG
jgi:hypothetical protein